jgi:hypothetical protein
LGYCYPLPPSRQGYTTTIDNLFYQWLIKSKKERLSAQLKWALIDFNAAEADRRECPLPGTPNVSMVTIIAQGMAKEEMDDTVLP